MLYDFPCVNSVSNIFLIVDSSSFCAETTATENEENNKTKMVFIDMVVVGRPSIIKSFNVNSVFSDRNYRNGSFDTYTEIVGVDNAFWIMSNPEHSIKIS
jgi:hypothetical protein